MKNSELNVIGIWFRMVDVDIEKFYCLYFLLVYLNDDGNNLIEGDGEDGGII